MEMYNGLHNNQVDKFFQFETLTQECWREMRVFFAIGLRHKTKPRPGLVKRLLRAGVQACFLTQAGEREAQLFARELGLGRGKERVVIDFADALQGRRVFEEILEKFSLKIEQIRSRANQPKKRNLPQKLFGLFGNKKVRGKLTEGASSSAGDSRSHLERYFDFQLLRHRQFTLLLNGRSLAPILSSPYLFLHFKMLLKFSLTTLGYNFSPQNKRELVRLVRAVNPGYSVLGVCSSRGDEAMLGECDARVSMRDRNSWRHLCDAVVRSLEDLGFLVFEWGRRQQHKLVELIITCFVANFGVLVVEFISDLVANSRADQDEPQSLQWFVLICSFVFGVFHLGFGGSVSKRMFDLEY